jgi:HPr kinase/phosphorylase
VPEVSVRALYSAKKDDLKLELLSPEELLHTSLFSTEVNRFGLSLAGHVGKFLEESVQVFGQTEMAYLKSISAQRRKKAIEHVMQFSIPLIVVTRGLELPEGFIELAHGQKIPVMGTTLATGAFIKRLSAYLEYMLAPRSTVHGSLVDVYGVGLLYTGRAAIGKSECALDLIERGHRLVADDVVTIFRRGQVLIGQANELTGFHMEIRGIGIINVEALFGVRAVRLQKRVEVVVDLAQWDGEEQYERLGLDYEYTNILGVEVPKVTIPIFPGKNITVISEVVAMNHILRVCGCNPATEFENRLVELLRQKRSADSYLEEDEE